MNDTVIVALITLAGTLAGVFVSNKLVVFRIERLEEAVKENQKLVDRVYTLEKQNEIQDTKLEYLEDEKDRIIYDVKQIKKGAV